MVQPLLCCKASVSVKENLDRKKCQYGKLNQRVGFFWQTGLTASTIKDDDHQNCPLHTLGKVDLPQTMAEDDDIITVKF